MTRGKGVTPSRRRLLAASGAAIAALAGCTGDDQEDVPDESSQTQATMSDPEDGVVLDDLTIVNFDGQDRTFHLLVEHDDETVHWDDHVADAEHGDQSRLTVDADVPRTAGRITVRARVDGHQVHAELDDLEGVCLGLQVVYDPGADGEPLDVFRSVRECPERFAGDT